MDISGRRIILLVEDEEQQAKAIIKKIESAGNYKAVWASNGYEGLEQVRKHGRLMGFAGNKLACILLDMRMPKMDGVEFIKKLRKREKWRLFERHCPVIFLTAYQEEQYYRAAMNEYACQYLNKPVDQEELTSLLKKVVEDYDYFSAVESNRDKMWENIKELRMKQKTTEQGASESKT